MTVSGGTTTHGIPKFADGDVPDLAAGGLGSILDTLDSLIGAYKIRDVALAAPGAVSISGIPANFRHLLLTWYAGSNIGGSDQIVAAQINGDAGGTNPYAYDYYDTNFTGGLGYFHSDAAPAMQLGVCGNVGNGYGVGWCVFPNYAATVRIMATFHYFNRGFTRTSGFGGALYGGAAIMSSLLLTAGGGNFGVNSSFTLYGLA